MTANRKDWRSPHALHQILIVDGGELPAPLPAHVAKNAEELRRHHPKATYRLWSGAEVRDFIAVHFGRCVVDAYDLLQPYAYRCDLARLCVLYVEGGLYCDVGVRLMTPFSTPPDVGFAAFKDLSQSTHWYMMQNGLIWSLPGRPELKFAIDWIVENCRTRYYGRNPLFPTGPVQLGRAAAAVSLAEGPGGDPGQWIGECRAITPSLDVKNMTYIAPDLTLVAVRTKLIAGDLSHLGVRGANNHNSLWQSRAIYGEQTAVWTASDEQIRLIGVERVASGIRVPPGVAGRITYGPYVNLPPDRYCLRITFSPETRFSSLFVDISGEAGHDSLAGVRVEAGANHGKQAEIFFDVVKLCKGVEFRLESDGEFDGEIQEFALTRISQGERQWRFDDPALRLNGLSRSKTGVAIRPATFGRVLYGPYAPCDAGDFDFSVEFSLDTQFSRLRIEVCAQSGSRLLHVCESSSTSLGLQNVLTFAFRLDRAYEDVEFRFETYGDFEGEIRKLTLRPHPVSAEDSQDAPTLPRPTRMAEGAAGRNRLRGLLRRLAG